MRWTVSYSDFVTLLLAFFVSLEYRIGRVTAIVTAFGFLFATLGLAYELIISPAIDGVNYGFQNQLLNCITDCESPWHWCVVSSATLRSPQEVQRVDAVNEFILRACLCVRSATTTTTAKGERERAAIGMLLLFFLRSGVNF